MPWVTILMLGTAHTSCPQHMFHLSTPSPFPPHCVPPSREIPALTFQTGREMPGPRCEEAAPLPPFPANLLSARPRRWISWREGARHCADASPSAALHPALTKHRGEQLANRRGWPACGDTAARPAPGREGTGPAGKHVTSSCLAAASQGPGRNPLPWFRHLAGAWGHQDHWGHLAPRWGWSLPMGMPTLHEQGCLLAPMPGGSPGTQLAYSAFGGCHAPVQGCWSGAAPLQGHPVGAG